MSEVSNLSYGKRFGRVWEAGEKGPKVFRSSDAQVSLADPENVHKFRLAMEEECKTNADIRQKAFKMLDNFSSATS